MIKKILIFLLIVFIVIQFFHPAKNISTAAMTNDIAMHFNVPSGVHDVLKKSCYDCHSNNTVYPWYNNIKPVAWWMANHVKDGKKELNFSEFSSYTAKRQYHKLNDVIEQIKKDEMPLDSYLWIHKDAILSKEQKKIIISWADSFARDIKTKNNLPDEPERRHD